MTNKSKRNILIYKKTAFTLAEVLITLGIIGVVAAITIPTLINNYNTKTWNTTANVFERKLEEALKTMNTQSTLAGHTTTESFVDELSKHFKTNKICGNDKLLDCFSKTVYWGSGDAQPKEIDVNILKTSKNLGQKNWNSNIVGVQFANGVSALIAYNPLTSGDDACTQDPHSNTITGKNCLAILYDTSGEKNPNTSSKDLRANGNVTMLGSGCFAEIDDVCVTAAPQIPIPHVWNECINGTSNNADDQAFMAEYGINYCHTGNDYWAGAARLCGGVSKMASNADLLKIANYVYETDSIKPTGSTSGITFNGNKAAELGLPTSDFYLWSNEEIGENNAYIRTFRSYTSWNSNHRYNGGLLAICTGE